MDNKDWTMARIPLYWPGRGLGTCVPGQQNRRLNEWGQFELLGNGEAGNSKL